MTKNVLMAMRTLPEQFVADGTEFTEWAGYVLVCHPEHQPMKWTEESGWSLIQFMTKHTDAEGAGKV